MADLGTFLAFLKTPQGAAAGAGVVGVAGFALYKRHKSNAGGSSGASVYNAGSVPTDSQGNPIAGLAGYPDTLATDIENAVAGQLNDETNYLNERLAAFTPPAPAPKVGPSPHPPSTNPPPHGRLPHPPPRPRRPLHPPAKKPPAKKPPARRRRR